MDTVMKDKMLDVVVVWLGRDLRLHDNPALMAALLTAKRLVIAYVWAPEEEAQFQPGRASRWWLYQSLKTLEKQIETRGAFICYRRGPRAVDQILQICKEVSASAVYFNNAFDPLSLVRDHEVKAQLNDAGIVAHNFNAELLFEPWTVLDDNGGPFTTFEGFWEKAISMPSPPAPSFTEPPVINTVHNPCLRKMSLDDLNIVTDSEQWSYAHFADKWTPGTMAGLMLLVDFLDNRLPDFNEDRSKVDRDSTSRLSPYIHFGEVSVRVIYHEVKQREQAMEKTRPGACATFLKQVGYREYSRYLSFHFPFTHERPLLQHVRAVPWIHCPVRFKAWRQGMTGYPIVDAAMRQLWVTGWMHNRARVFTASFLVKNLLLPWQWGLKHFWDMLLDADLESDALGWQYVAGCLRDARPFTYMLDFKSESRRFDPDGAYVRKWVPELAQIPLQYIHHPWNAPQAVLAQAGVVLGVEYPVPIISVDESRAAVDHAYGVAQKCNYVHTLEPEPYQLPSIPIKIGLLEAEEEVDQVCPGQKRAAPDVPNTADIIDTLRHSKHPELQFDSFQEGSLLRKEQYPPSCVLPEIPEMYHVRPPASSTAVSCKASCMSTPNEDDVQHFPAEVHPPGCSASGCEGSFTCSHKSARSGLPTSAVCGETAASGERDNLNLLNGQQKAVRSLKRGAGDEMADVPASPSRCSAGESGKCSSAADYHMA